MISILEFSATEKRDIRPGCPEPDMCGTGWHCSICGEKVSSSQSACHMHEVDPRSVSGTFCALSDNKIPDHAREIQFLLDNIIITLKCAIIRPAPHVSECAVVSSAPVDARYERVYYAFEASNIEYDWENEDDRQI